MRHPLPRFSIRGLLLVTSLITSSCSKQLSEPCIEKGKVYRSLGSLKSNFVDIDQKYLRDLIHLSEALQDKWIRTGAETGDLEIWVIDYSTLQDGKYYFQFKTQHRHILHPTFPKNSKVKLPCTLLVSFDLDHPGGTRIYGTTDLELKLAGEPTRTAYGSWQLNRETKRIEFREEGRAQPSLYWQL